jgi:hypothetical protein
MKSYAQEQAHRLGLTCGPAITAPITATAATTDVTLAGDPTTFAAADIVIAAGNADEGDTLDVDATAIGGPAVTFTFTATPSLDSDVEIGVDANATAANLEVALDLAGNGLAPYTTATVSTDTVTLTSDVIGAVGNGVTLATSAPANIELESATLEGGLGDPDGPDRVVIEDLQLTLAAAGTVSVWSDASSTGTMMSGDHVRAAGELFLRLQNMLGDQGEAVVLGRTNIAVGGHVTYRILS